MNTMHVVLHLFLKSVGVSICHTNRCVRYSNNVQNIRPVKNRPEIEATDTLVLLKAQYNEAAE